MYGTIIVYIQDHDSVRVWDKLRMHVIMIAYKWDNYMIFCLPVSPLDVLHNDHFLW